MSLGSRVVIVLLAWFYLVDAVPAQAQTSFESAPVTSTTQGAKQVLEVARQSVIQVKVFFGPNTAPASHGSGFAVTASGDFITNYHVVADYLQLSEKYRLEYRSTDGRTGRLSVKAFDLLNDLALVHADDFSPPPLSFAETAAARGEKAYSVGFPLDIGLTITEGVANGQIEDSFQPRVHYSGAINAGMSGGPAFNSAAQVIGVNVSGYPFLQLISFLVPAEKALELGRGKLETVPTGSDIGRTIIRQMHRHSDDLMSALEGPLATQMTEGYVLPGKIAPFVDCGANGNPLRNDPVDRVNILCYAKAGVFIKKQLSSGDIQYRHIVETTDKLDAWRFAYRLSALTGAMGKHRTNKEVGPFACEDRIVALKGFDAAVAVCVRSYRKFEGLYDFTVRVSSMSGVTHGFASHLDILGVGFDDGMDFVRRYVAAMEWKS